MMVGETTETDHSSRRGWTRVSFWIECELLERWWGLYLRCMVFARTESAFNSGIGDLFNSELRAYLPPPSSFLAGRANGGSGFRISEISERNSIYSIRNPDQTGKVLVSDWITNTRYDYELREKIIRQHGSSTF